MIVCALIISMIVLILWGNGSTILAFIVRRKLRQNPSYWFIVSLSVMDFLTGLVLTPFNVYWYWDPVLRKDQTICDINLILLMLFMTPTAYHLMIISADRYFKLVSPLRYKSIMTIKKAAITIVIIWILDILTAFVMVYPDHYYGKTCYSIYYSALSGSSIHFLPSFLTTLFINIPLIGLIYFNIRTYIIAAKFNHVVSREMSNQPGDDRVYIRYNLGKIVVERCYSDDSNGQPFRGKNTITSAGSVTENQMTEWFKTSVKNKKLSLLIGMIVISAAGCWIPSNIMYHIKHVHPEYSHWTLEFHPWLLFLNSAFNPFILLALSEDFRSGYMQLYGLRNVPLSTNSNQTPQQPLPKNTNIVIRATPILP